MAGKWKLKFEAQTENKEEVEEVEKWNAEIDKYHESKKWMDEKCLGTVPVINLVGDEKAYDKLAFDSLKKCMTANADAKSVSVATFEFKGKIFFVSYCDDNKVGVASKMKFGSIREQLKGQLEGIQKNYAATDAGELDDLEDIKV